MDWFRLISDEDHSPVYLVLPDGCLKSNKGVNMPESFEERYICSVLAGGK